MTDPEAWRFSLLSGNSFQLASSGDDASVFMEARDSYIACEPSSTACVCRSTFQPKKASVLNRKTKTGHMGGGGSREIHHHHEDKASKELARQAQEQMEALRRQQEAQRRIEEENERRRQEELRQAELRRQEAERKRLEEQENERRRQEEKRQAELRRQEAAERERQRLQQEQENRKREAERARAEKERQAREAKERRARELQRERDNAHRAKLEKWQRLKRDYPIPDFLKDYANEVNPDAEVEARRSRFANLAFVGDSGNGKSSLIKAILKHFGVDLPADQMPRISMEGDGTLEPSRFPLAILGQVSLWDLPGQGTSKIPSMTYLCNMGLKYFDAVCIVTDGRWSEGDDNLLVAIHYAGIRCFVVRSKVDLAVDAGVEDKGWSQTETLSYVHRQLQEQTRLKSHRIHLVTSRERFWKDFGSVDDFCTHLKHEVEASLRDEPVEQLFDQAPQEDVNMDDCDDGVMAPPGPVGVKHLRAAAA